MGDDRSKPPPLERRVPGATRAGPASPTRPELPEALLQRMQAVVNAAHAQAMQEEARRDAQPDQDAPPQAPASLPKREPEAAGTPKPSNGVRWPKRPTAPPGRLPDKDAESDTDPFLPRVTAAGSIASPPVNGTAAEPGQAAQQNHRAQQTHTTQDHTAQQDDTARPDHALKRDRAPRRRNHSAAKRDRAGKAGRERAARERSEQEQAEREQAARERSEQEQAEREQAARERSEQEQAEREQAARERSEQEQAEREQAARERSEQEQAEREQAARERSEQEQAEREQAARERSEQEQAEREQAERERAAQAERATQAKRELAAEAAWAEREHAAQAEHDHAAQADCERPGQAAAAEGPAEAEQGVAERPGQAQRTAPSDQAEPDPTASPTSRAAAAVRAPVDLLEHSRPGSLKTPGRRRSRMAAWIAVGAVALAAGPLALVLSRHSPTKLSAAEIARDQAAAWVAQQVSSDAVVSCDVTMCLALKADGVSSGDLLVMGPQERERDLLRSQVIVSTAAIRNLFGSRLPSAYAPMVLASFGSGKARIDVRVIAPDGAASYLSALKADWQQRKTIGRALASAPQITLTPTARRQMDGGQVDVQLLLVLTNMASIHSLDILAFGDATPGASPGIPLRCVYLAENGGTAVVRSMLGFLHQQQGYFRAARAETTQFDAQSALFIEFDAPSPLLPPSDLGP